MTRHSYVRSASKTRHAFTLVELLVVIGIIALLISILLPSLNRAREAAKSIKCAANLHSLGNALQIYLQDNKGMCPIGYNDGTVDYKTSKPNGLTGNAALQQKTNWALLLLNSLSNKVPTNAYDVGQMVNKGSGAMSPQFQVLQCPTAPAGNSGMGNQIIYHYMAHPRIFMTFRANNGDAAKPGIDPATGATWTTTKASRVKRSSDMITVFDGSLQYNNPSDTFTTVYDNPSAYGLDHARMIGNTDSWGTTWLSTAVKPTYGTMNSQEPVNMTGYYNKTTAINLDSPDNQANIRFRHNANTTANALMFDGHVQSFRISRSTGIPDLLRGNINVGE